MILEEQTWNNKYKRMINSIGEAFFMADDTSLTFTNEVADNIVNQAKKLSNKKESSPSETLSDFFREKIFYKMSKNENEKPSKEEQKTSTEGLSLKEIVEQHDQSSISNHIFTFHSEIANCDSMSRLSMIIEHFSKRKV